MSNPKPTDLWVLEEEERWKESKERLHKSLKEIEDKARRDAIKELPIKVLKEHIEKFIMTEPYNKGDFNKTREVCWVWVRQIIDTWYNELLCKKELVE